jgi:hypothetical protein
LDFVIRPQLRVLWTLLPPATSGGKLAPYVGCPFPLFIIIRQAFKPNKKRSLLEIANAPYNINKATFRLFIEKI